MRQVLARLVRIGAAPTDDDDIRLQKSLLVLCAFPFMLLAVGWGLLYLFCHEPRAGAIPLSYACVSALSIGSFAVTRRYRWFRFSQLLLILLLPFFLMLTLGGFIGGSAVILWGLISPLGALLFDEPRHAYRWFLSFALLVAVSGFVEPYLRATNNLSVEMVKFFFVINILGVSSLVMLMVVYFVGQKNAFQTKSETLLLNILPKEIAAILRREQRTIAEHFEQASILFADIVDFTPVTARMSPVELVNLLNEVFSHFDSLVDERGLEKIKTIGDCYMVAAGVPRPRADHASAIVQLALDMHAYIRDRNATAGVSSIRFRMGVNSGPVVAGVIGRKKFIYDLWGDAVNTASRMESHGQAGSIQVTRATYELIKDDFECEPRGPVTIKGKGEMETWLVTARKGALAA